MRVNIRLTVPVIASLAFGCGKSQETPRNAQPGADAVNASCESLETRSPNAFNQQPAFDGQTRACGTQSSVAFGVDVIARGLEHPWAVEPLPDGNFLVTERPGRMRIVSATGSVGEPIAGLPRVEAGGQGGLLDVALSPRFASDRTVFWSYTEPRSDGNGTSVARGVLAPDGQSLSQVQVIFRALPSYENSMHFGSRIAFDKGGQLFITLGDRSDARMRKYAQDLTAHLGKTIRINPDGTVPSDNPFAGKAGARPEIWSVGHRNVQAATVDPQGRYWIVEHGTRGGDELNLIEKGKNYGWPRQAYGVEYSGAPIAGASPAPPNYEQPRYFWDPVIAPSGAQFYTGSAFPEWKNNLFVGSLKEEQLVRLVLENDRVVAEEHLLEDRGKRVRDVRQGNDGSLYVVTDEGNGELWKITPRR